MRSQLSARISTISALAASFTLTSLLAAQTAPVVPARDSTPEETLVLSPFEVVGQTNSGYLSGETTASGRVSQKLENIPQQIDIVNAAMLEDISPTSAIDALRYVAGASPNTDETSSTALSVRGFTVPNMRRNGGRSGNATFPNTEFTDQMEVVKGPAAVLYGSSNPGGTVNVVTKRPKFRSEQSVKLTGYALGGTSGFATDVDVTGPLPLLTNAHGKSLIAYRLMAVHQRMNDFRMNDDVVNRDAFLAALMFNPTASLTIQSEYEQSQYITNLPNGLILAASEAAKPARERLMPDSYLPVDWTAQSDDSRRANYSHRWQSSFTYTKRTERFGDWAARLFLNLEGSYNQRPQTISTGVNARPRPVVQADLGKAVNLNEVVTQADINAGRMWVPLRSMQNSIFMNDDQLSSQWDITGRFSTAWIKHTMLLGTETEWGHRNSRVAFGAQENDVRTVAAYTGNGGRALAIWVDKPNLAPVPVNWNDLRNASNPNGTITQVLQGATFDGTGYEAKVPWVNVTPDAYYAHDDLSLFDGRVVLTVGARHDDIEQNVRGVSQTFSQWTYRYGAVVKITNWVNVYASHSESFTPNSATAAGDLGRVIPPQQGVQDEVGLRFSLLDRRLGATVSAYKLTNNNLIVRNSHAPVGAPAEQFWTFIDGTEINGLEASLTLNLTPQTQALINYSYLDGTSTPTLEQQDASPGLTSLPLNQIARDQFSFWGKWTAARGRIKGLSFRGGYRWTGERPGGRAGFLPDFYMPAYGIAEFGVGYRWKRVTLDCLVRNVLDEYAFRSSGGEAVVYPEKPRNLTLSARYQF